MEVFGREIVKSLFRLRPISDDTALFTSPVFQTDDAFQI
jgi:hypothetical protein